MTLTAQQRLIVALDKPDYDSAKDLVETLGDMVSVYKVGIELFTDVGPKILDWLGERKKKVFLDLKFYDIPRSVSQAAVSAIKHNVFMVNLHLLGGALMVRQTVMKIKEISKEMKKTPPLVIGVTVLTSLTGEDLKRVGIEKNVESLVMDLAGMGKLCGLDGVVASAGEAKIIKEKLGKDFLVVSPGIRPSDASFFDQKRVSTPKKAIEAGADFLVVGRPITGAENPGRTAQKIIQEIEECLNA